MFNRVLIGSIAALMLGLLNAAPANAAEYTTPAQWNIDASVFKPTAETYTTTAVGLCPIGTVISSSNTITSGSSQVGHGYAIADRITLNDGTVVQVTNIGSGGSLTADGLAVISPATSSTDPTTSATNEFTIPSGSELSSVIGASASTFSAGCIAITSSVALDTSEVSLGYLYETDNNILKYDPTGPDNGPDGSWPTLGWIFSKNTEYPRTYRFPYGSRLPLQWWTNSSKFSSINMSQDSLNETRLIFDSDPYGSVTSQNTFGNPQWNGFSYTWGLPDSVLIEAMTSRYGEIKAKTYNSNTIFDTANYRGPTPIESVFYRNDAVLDLSKNGVCSNFASWMKDTAYSVGTIILVTDGSGNDYIYQVSTAGTSGDTIPSFAFDETADVSDGTVAWVFLGKQSSGKDSRYSNTWCDTHNWNTNVLNYDVRTSSNVGTTAENILLTTSGNNGYGGFDIGQYTTVMQSGNNWSWAQVVQTSDLSGNAAGWNDPTTGVWTKNGHMNYGEEWDMSGIGYENPDTAIDPVVGQRVVFWFSTWTSGDNAWAASHAYALGDMIDVPDTSGNKWLYTAVVAGTSAATIPSFTFTETKSTTITDGTVKWQRQGPRRYQISRFIGVDKNQQADDSVEFGSLFSAASNVYGATFDLSKVTYTGTGLSILLRTHADTYLDMSSDGTASGEGNNLFGWASTNGGMWRFKGTSTYGDDFDIESGGILVKTVAPSVVAAGTDLSTATTLPSVANAVVTSGTGGVKLPADMSKTGAEMRVMNLTSSAIQVYPIDGGWNFVGQSSGEAITVAAGAVKTFVMISSGSDTNTILPF